MIPQLLTAWFLTYLLHSTLLLALACVAGRWLARRSLALEETVWRAALFGAFLTATLQVAFGGAPLGGSWTLAAAAERELAPASVSGPAAEAERPARRLVDRPSLPDAVAGRTATASAGALAAAATASASHTTAAEQKSPSFPTQLSSAAATADEVSAHRRPALLSALSRIDWPAVLLTLWATGACVLLLRLGASYLLLRRYLRGRAEVSGGTAFRLLARIAGATPLRRARLTCAPHLPVPVAMGLRRPEIALPPRALAELDAEEMAGLLAHEMGHLARRDPVWLLLGQLAGALAFVQPLNRVALRRLREISELLCDEWSVRRTGSALSLARCLAEVARWSLPAGRRAALPAPGMMGRPSQLARRIRRLLDGAHPDERRPRAAWLLGAVALLLVAVVAFVPGVAASTAMTSDDEGAVAEAPEAPDPAATAEAETAPDAAEAPEAEAPESEAPEATPEPPGDDELAAEAPEPPPVPLPTPVASAAPRVPAPLPTPVSAPDAPAPPPATPGVAPVPPPSRTPAHATPAPEATPRPARSPRSAAPPPARPPHATPAPGAAPAPPRPPRAPRPVYHVPNRERAEEIERLAEDIAREAERVMRRLEPELERLEAEIERATERHAAEIDEHVEKLVERHARELETDVERLAEQAERLAEAGKLSAEDRERLEEAARRLAETALPTEAEMEAVRRAIEANREALDAVRDSVLRSVEEAMRALERELARSRSHPDRERRELEREQEEAEETPAPEPPRR